MAAPLADLAREVQVWSVLVWPLKSLPAFAQQTGLDLWEDSNFKMLH